MSFALKRQLISTAWLLTSISLVAGGQEFEERFTDWPLETSLSGKLILSNSTEELSALARFLDRSELDGRCVVLCSEADSVELERAYNELFSEVLIVHAIRELDLSEAPRVVAWHVSPNFRSEFQYLARHQRVFSEHVSNGGTLIVAGSAAEWCSRWYLTDHAAHPAIAAGANLLPECVVKLDFNQQRDQPRLLSVLASHPKSVGIGLESQAVLMLTGRKFLVAGGKATFLLTANERQPNRIETIEPFQRGVRQSATSLMIDLTEWRRDAIDRQLEPFPPGNPSPPYVDQGTLFIVGGGGMPEGLMDRFIEAAGGVDDAKLVYIPCAEEESVSPKQRIVESWLQRGVHSATFLHTKDRRKAHEDEAFYAPLREATGVWFGGGRQWNFADSYYGTTTHRLMKEVLSRGGAIGGSSAGASIQARYLCRATPIENFRPMAPGYERGGFGFITGVAIDQHFAQRNRFSDMSSLVNRYPQLLGIGIDESTALIVEKSSASVVGRGQVHFYDRRRPVYPDRPDFISLEAGQSFDLAERSIIE